MGVIVMHELFLLSFASLSPQSVSYVRVIVSLLSRPPTPTALGSSQSLEWELSRQGSTSDRV